MTAGMWNTHIFFLEDKKIYFPSLFTSDLDDLFDVVKELNLVSAKWNSIGIALRLRPNTLDGFKGGDPSACLTSTLTEWLKKNYNVKRFGEPTWQWLVKAVGDPAGGANMGHARDMAGRHKARGMSSMYAVSNCKKHKNDSIKTT